MRRKNLQFLTKIMSWSVVESGRIRMEVQTIMETNMKTHTRNGGQHGKRILKVVVKQVEDSDPDVSYLEQDRF
jgi:hypothetical protein